MDLLTALIILTGKTNVFVHFYISFDQDFFWLHLLFEMAVDICISYSCLKSFFVVIVHSVVVFANFSYLFHYYFYFFSGNCSQAGIVS